MAQATYSTYSTSSFPQTWTFSMNVGDGDSPRWDELNFCLTRDDSRSSGLAVSFGDNCTCDPDAELPIMANVVYLGKQLIRLAELEATMKNDNKVMETMPKYEWEMAWTYHQALMASISEALLASGLVGSGVRNPADSDDDSEDKANDLNEGDSNYDSEGDSEDWEERDNDDDSGDESRDR